MLKQRRQYAEDVAAALFAAEAAIDAALASTAGLAAVMPSRRAEAGLSALIGQDAVERAGQALVALTEARRAIVETHKELSVAQEQMGLGRVVMNDYGGDKPPTLAEDGRAHARHLRSIRAA